MDTKTLRPKMYVSLPMTGIENNNKKLETEAFHVARKLGYWVYTPGRMADYVEKNIKNPSYKHFLGFDIWSLSRCDAMLLCPGWENSKGCKTEVRFALENDIAVYDFKTGKLFEFDSDFLKESNLLSRNYEFKKMENTIVYENLFVWFLVFGLAFFILSVIIHWFTKFCGI